MAKILCNPNQQFRPNKTTIDGRGLNRVNAILGDRLWLQIDANTMRDLAFMIYTSYAFEPYLPT